MTDTSKQELIEEAAKALLGRVLAWDDAWGDAGGQQREVFRGHARSVLAVFEQAKTPSDDEREALDDQRDAIKHTLRNVKWTETGDLLGYIPEGVLGMYADAILAAGFRRTAVPEPSAEEAEALEAVRGWTRSSGPGVRVLRVLLDMAERAVNQGGSDDAKR